MSVAEHDDYYSSMVPPIALPATLGRLSEPQFLDPRDNRLTSLPGELANLATFGNRG